MDGFGGVAGATAEPRQQPHDEESSRRPKAQPRQPKKPIPSQRPQPPKKKKNKPTFHPAIEFFRGTQFRIGLGLFLLILSLVTLFVTINFIRTGVADQSIVAGSNVADIANAPEGVENIGGAAGAKWAHLLMIDGLGIGSFVMVIYTGVLALSLFGIMRCRFWAFTFRSLFTAIALSVIFGLFTYNAETTFHWGGNHGHYVNQWLYHVSDALGAYAVTIFLIGMLAVIYLTQLRSIYVNVSGRVAKARQAMAEAAAEGRKTSTEVQEVPGESGESDDVVVAGKPVRAATVAAASAKVAAPVMANPIVGFSIDDSESGDDASEVAEAAGPVAVRAHAVVGEPEFRIKTSLPGQPSDDDPATATDGTDMEGDEVALQPYSIRDELSHYSFPTPDLLIDRPNKAVIDEQEQEENKNLIVKTLRDYGIPIARIEATIGPTVTLYEIVPAEGVRIAQIKRLEDDIALSLAALGIRIIAPIPGKGTVGIEVPNRDPQTVSMFSVINSPEFRDCKMLLPMALGYTINNKVFIVDLAKMPHLLVAGATGMGKSVGLNCILASLLFKKHPGELKLVLIDPKMVEFSLYSKLEKHFLAKIPYEDDAIVTDASKALATLSSLCVEMDARYELLRTAAVRTVEEYNRKFSERRLNPEKGHRYLPYIVVVVDEFADLIMTAGKDISNYIARIAQKARAVGMHMIIATQRPSTDIITGMIKANFPGRIAFRVAQMVDSRTILDQPGANRLIGRGDMLFSHNSRLERVQCAFIDTPEVEALVDYIDNQIGYPSAYELPEPPKENGGVAPGAIDLSKRDEMFDVCAEFVVQNSTASTSSLQRRFSIGYNKAGKIMDQLEAAGIVGPADGQKPRAVLVDSISLQDILRSL